MKSASADKEEGISYGSMIRFVNMVSKHFEKDYPNLIIIL